MLEISDLDSREIVLICVFVFAYAKSRFSHDVAHMSTAILPLPLIQEEHLSVNGERMGAK